VSNRRPNAPGKPSKATIQKRAAAQRAMAAASGARAERRRRLMMVLSPIAVVLLVVIIFVVVKANTGTNHKANTATQAQATLTTAVTTVPAAVYDKVGVQSVSGPSKTLTGAALTKNGKPEVLYVGADWCPYCAAERWALAAALSRFGTLTDLGQTASSPDDTDPNTNTLSFHGSKYSSTVITATTKEIEDGAHAQLDKLTTEENQLFSTIGNNGFPFIDIGGKYQFGVQYDPAILKGLTHAEIAADMSDPSSKVGKAIIGSANMLSAAICTVTNNQPAKVCKSTAVTAAQGVLVSSSSAGSGTTGSAGS
jgi:hypothetical protein